MRRELDLLRQQKQELLSEGDESEMDTELILKENGKLQVKLILYLMLRRTTININMINFQFF